MAILKNRIFWIALFVTLSTTCVGQNLDLKLSLAQTQIFQGKVFCFGIREVNKQSILYLYKLEPNLKVTDSLNFDLGISNSIQYLRCSADTLHGFLNIRVQKKNNGKISIFRFDSKFTLKTRIDNIEVARLNSINLFSSELIYFGKEAYSIKKERDSSGYQFYLNKYNLKSETENFEYEFKWQFPFERKNIMSTHLFFANSQFVLLYVMVAGGQKSGQWVLKINSQNGQLIRGTKLNEKAEENSYTFGSFLYNSQNKSILIIGEKFNGKQYHTQENLLAIAGYTSLPIFLMTIDSIGDINSKQFFSLPITENKTNQIKTKFSYLLQFHNLKSIGQEGYQFEGDLYKCAEKSLCLEYCNSFYFNIKKNDDKLQLEKKSIGSQSQIESFLTSKDKLNRNGKICLDTSLRIEQWFYERPTFEVKLCYKTDSLARPKWLLCRSNLNKSSISFHLLQANKTTFEIKTLEEISIEKDPIWFKPDEGSLLVGRQEDAENYQLKIFRW